MLGVNTAKRAIQLEYPAIQNVYPVSADNKRVKQHKQNKLTNYQASSRSIDLVLVNHVKFKYSTNDLYPYRNEANGYDVIKLTCIHKWPISTSDLYQDTSGVYDCDIKKLTWIHKWPVSKYKWSLWMWHHQTDQYPQMTCIQIQIHVVLMTVTSTNWPVSRYR